MVGKTWSEKEEKLFWRFKIPQSPKGLGLDKLRIEKPWKELAVEMCAEMGSDARREYGALMLFEHFFQNAVNERFSPHAAFYVLDYIKKYEAQHGETPAHHRKMGKYDTRRPQPDDHEISGAVAHKTRKTESNKTTAKAASTSKATEMAPANSKLADGARGMKHKRIAQGARSENATKNGNKKQPSKSTPVNEASAVATASPAPEVSSQQAPPTVATHNVVSAQTATPVQDSTPIQGTASQHIQSAATVSHTTYNPHGIAGYQGFQPLDYEAAATIQAMKSHATSHNYTYQYGFDYHGHTQTSHPQHGYAQNSHLQNGYTQSLYPQGFYGQNPYAQYGYGQNMYPHSGRN